jgi:hypothetical protein
MGFGVVILEFYLILVAIHKLMSIRKYRIDILNEEALITL